MKRGVLLAIVIFWGALLLSCCAQKMPEKIEWATSLDEALKTAQDQDKPIIADFWSDG